MKIVQRVELKPDQWNIFVDAHPACWFWWRAEWIDYCLAHSGGTDRSFAIVEADEIVGLCPLIQERDQFSMGGGPCAWPVMAASNFDTRSICDAMAAELERLVGLSAIKQARFRRSPLNGNEPVMRLDGYKDISWQSQVIDLTAPDLWAGVKDGHRAEVHRGLRELMVVTHTSEPRWDEFRELHKHEAGRTTRPQATWDMMRGWQQAGNGDLIMAFRAGQAVGAAYFITYKQCMYYASAAWPEGHVSHAVIWMAMRNFKERGYKQLEMGWLDHQTLAVFKRGFGGEPKTVHCVERRWP